MDDRALSVAVNYTTSLIIVTMLMTGLLMAGGDFLDQQQEATIDAEFQVIGNRVASDLGTADRLVAATTGTSEDTVRLTTELPESTAGSQYTITINSSTSTGDVWNVAIHMNATSATIIRTVRLKTQTRVLNTSTNGGNFEITYVDDDGDGTPDALEVRGR